VPLRRREIELSLERPLPGDADGRVRLSARFDADGEEPPTPAELASALDGLRADLEVLVGVPIAAAGVARPARELSELVSAYRPRQRELVDLLRDEGEISAAEHARLVEYLAAAAPVAPAPPTTPTASTGPARPALDDRPIAAAPIVAERPTEGVRPVADLLRQYQIESLKQAGAVRARRQISFAEYMALKRHFEGAPPSAPA
jgi:hypothetical protein